MYAFGAGVANPLQSTSISLIVVGTACQSKVPTPRLEPAGLTVHNTPALPDGPETSLCPGNLALYGRKGATRVRNRSRVSGCTCRRGRPSLRRSSSFLTSPSLILSPEDGARSRRGWTPDPAETTFTSPHGFRGARAWHTQPQRGAAVRWAPTGGALTLRGKGWVGMPTGSS